MLRMTATSPTSSEYRHAGIINSAATMMGMKPKPAPSPPLASATAIMPTPMSRSITASMNQIIFVFLSTMRTRA